jgi:hypothetical protein
VYKCLLREDHRLVVFKNRVLGRKVESEGEGTSCRLENYCTLNICVKYYLDDKIKDMRWARHVEGMQREKVVYTGFCLGNLKNVTTWKTYL